MRLLARCEAAVRKLATAAAVVGAATAQSGALRCVGVAVAGGTVTVQVGCNSASIEVHDPTTGGRTSYTVPPGRDVTITVPNVPPGTRLLVRTGRGLDASVIQVEVVSAS